MTEYTARNGDERYVFEGDELGFASTAGIGHPLRWTEITIWRTKAGKYVIERVGRSVVYHLLDGYRFHEDEADYGVIRPVGSLRLSARSCPLCKPELGQSPDDEVKVETDRYNTVVTDNAPAAVEACHLTDNDPDSEGYGTRFLPNVARRALTEAADKDPDLRDAFLTQRIA